jgi:hypothetical protein
MRGAKKGIAAGCAFGELAGGAFVADQESQIPLPMIKKILLVLLAIVAVVLIVAAFQPNTYRVERSVTIAAPASVVFPQVNDLHKAQVWSPWVKLDPNGKYTFEGPASGVGAINAWAGNSNVGEGRQTIIESRPNELVRIKLEFFKPMAGEATAEFNLKSEGNDTRVTWSMSGPKNYMSKVMCMFMNMDKMIGGQFEKGLTDLKTQVEGAKK